MQRGGDFISQNFNPLTATRMIQVRSPLIQAALDLQICEQLRGEELLQVCIRWFQEYYGPFMVSQETFLMRARDQRILSNEQTLGEYGVENNDLFYLF